MPHLLIAGKLHPSGLALLESAAGVTFDYVDDVSEQGYVRLIGGADGLVIRTQPLTAETVAKAPNLKIVSRHGVGYDAVDVAALSARRIPLCVVGDVNSVAVAEHAMFLILAAAKKAVRADKAVRHGPWEWRNRMDTTEIFGKRLLILGYGRIGRRLARVAAGFEMKVRAFDPFLAAAGWPAGDVGSVDDLNEGLAWADVVSIHLPKADKPVLGAAQLAQLNPHAILVNTSRGGIVDEAALADALAAGRIAAVGLDVFAEEPPGPDNPLLAFDQAVLTPHNAALAEDGSERLAVHSVRNALDFFDGRLDPALIVNRKELETD